MSRNMDRLLMRLAASGTNKLEDEVGNLSADQWFEIDNRATELACRLFFVAKYAQYRGGTRCTGDHGHETAVKKANAHYKKARKLAGFAYP